MDIFWWAIIIIAVLSVLTLGAGLAIIVPLRNWLRARQLRIGYRVGPPVGQYPPPQRPPAPQYPPQRPPTAPPQQ